MEGQKIAKDLDLKESNEMQIVISILMIVHN